MSMLRTRPVVRRVAKRQTGVALIVGLLILLVLIIVGIAASNLATQQERMSRSSRDYNIAFQAAEAALRDAERDINYQTAVATVSPDPRRSPQIVDSAGFASDCGSTATQGLCLPAPAGTAPVWETTALDAAPSVPYGQFTGASLFPRSAQNSETYSAGAPLSASGGVGMQPRYLIEALRNPACVSGNTDCQPYYIYRITARGYGSDPRTQATLQEVYQQK
jgi:type IV pilus assembly protein PilX